MEQQNLFETPVFKIDKPIRLIELFAGIGAQAKALQNIGADFERYRVVEIEPLVVKTYNAVHGTHFAPLDITKISGEDLGVREREILLYHDLFVSLSRLVCGWKSERNGERVRNSQRFVMGSRKTS